MGDAVSEAPSADEGHHRRRSDLSGSGLRRPNRAAFPGPDAKPASAERRRRRTFVASGKLALMTLFENDGKYDVSNVSFRDGQILCYDKTSRLPNMTHTDYGLGALHAAALADYPAGMRLDLATVYRDLLARGDLAAYEVQERFYEIGSLAGLEETRRLLKETA
jgi:hypothetical protein